MGTGCIKVVAKETAKHWIDDEYELCADRGMKIEVSFPGEVNVVNYVQKFYADHRWTVYSVGIVTEDGRKMIVVPLHKVIENDLKRPPLPFSLMWGLPDYLSSYGIVVERDESPEIRKIMEGCSLDTLLTNEIKEELLGFFSREKHRLERKIEKIKNVEIEILERSIQERNQAFIDLMDIIDEYSSKINGVISISDAISLVNELKNKFEERVINRIKSAEDVDLLKYKEYRKDLLRELGILNNYLKEGTFFEYLNKIGMEKEKIDIRKLFKQPYIVKIWMEVKIISESMYVEFDVSHNNLMCEIEDKWSYEFPKDIKKFVLDIAKESGVDVDVVYEQVIISWDGEESRSVTREKWI